jgi:hypothetical protein
MRVLLVDAPEGPQVDMERPSCPFTGVAMALTAAIHIIILYRFVGAVGHACQEPGLSEGNAFLGGVDRGLRRACTRVNPGENGPQTEQGPCPRVDACLCMVSSVRSGWEEEKEA